MCVLGEGGGGGKERGQWVTSFINLYLSPQEAKLSQEQLADQVVKTSEEKHNLLKELDTVKKVGRRGTGGREGICVGVEREAV